MSIIKSLVFCSEGEYKFLGVPIIFEGGSNSLIERAVEVIFQRNVGTFAHELGHSLAYRIITKRNPRFIVIRPGSGETLIHRDQKITTAVGMAGPVAGMSYGICRLVAGLVLTNYLISSTKNFYLWPLMPALVFFSLAPQGLDWIFSELKYSFNLTGGDFYDIGKNNQFHSMVARSIVWAQFALFLYAVPHFV